MHVTLKDEPNNGQTITINNNSVTIFIGKNSAGKSRKLRSIKNQNNNSAILLSNNYETI